MPRGPKGERRPADVIGNAILIAKIATGEISEELGNVSGRTRSGKSGGMARKKALSPEQRKEIAKKAAAARWK